MKAICPDCSHDKVEWQNACHTWPGGTRTDGSTQWMSCQGCDSAIEYSCRCWLDDEVPNPDDPDGLLIYREPECECRWSYIHGFNKNNPRAERQELSRPPWLVGDLEFGEYGSPIPHLGVKSVWDD